MRQRQRLIFEKGLYSLKKIQDRIIRVKLADFSDIIFRSPNSLAKLYKARKVKDLENIVADVKICNNTYHTESVFRHFKIFVSLEELEEILDKWKL